LYYTDVEIIHYPDQAGSDTANQSEICATPQTERVPLPEPMLYAAPTDLVDGQDPLASLTSAATPTGSLDPGFVSALPSELQACVVGSWTAPQPTMIVVVDVMYARGVQIFLVHREISVTGGLDGPSSTATDDGGSGATQTEAAGGGGPQNTGTGGDGAGGGGIPVGPIISAIANGVTRTQDSAAGGAGGAGGVASNIIFGIGGNSGSNGDGSVNGVGFGAVTTGPAATQAPVVVAGQTFDANSNGQFDINGQTLAPGGSAIFVNGQTVSLSPSSTLVVNGISITPAPAVPSPDATFISLFGTTFQAAGGSPEFIIGGETLTPGGVITASGSTISLAGGSNPTAVVINGVTTPIGVFTQPPVLTIGNTVVSALPGGFFVVDGQTLLPGHVITVSGTTVSLAATGAIVVVNGVTSTLAATGVPYIVVGTMTYPATALPQGSFLIAGQELLPGQAITVSGTTISLAAGGSALIVNGVTEYLPGYAPLTVDGSTFLGNHGTYIVEGMTLTPGGAITVHGTTVSLLPGGTAVVVNGHTSTMYQPLTTPASASAKKTSQSQSTELESTRSPSATASKKSGSKRMTEAPNGCLWMFALWLFAALV
jgi:hypothetical protein